MRSGMGKAYASDSLRKAGDPAHSDLAIGVGSIDDEVLRAIVMTLLATYYRARPGDTRFEKRALAAMPAERREFASSSLERIIAVARRMSQRVET
jgi:hypothetical protein